MSSHRYSTPKDLGGLPPLTSEQIAQLEARNALQQFDKVVELIKEALEADTPLTLQPPVIKNLNRVAVQGLNPDAGEYRSCGVQIFGSVHQPPAPEEVPAHVEEMCDYFNQRVSTDDPIVLSAYLMWRVNWVHPFSNGNGRTSRAVAYLALSVCIGAELPGVPTVPDQIAANKRPYYDALDSADAAYRDGRIDVSLMTRLIGQCLDTQLSSGVQTDEG